MCNACVRAESRGKLLFAQLRSELLRDGSRTGASWLQITLQRTVCASNEAIGII